MKKILFHKERGEGELSAIIGLLLIVLILIWFVGKIVSSYNYAHTESELTARILATETKTIDEKGHWFVNVQPVVKVDNVYENAGDPETLEIADSYTYDTFSSSDVYFKLKNDIGAVYHFKLQGWRNPHYSEFRNIVGLQQVQAKGR